MQKDSSLSNVFGALPVFECVARNMSFTRAAEELSLSQAAVSRRISRLEKSLGVPLFERHHNKLQITHDGRKILAAVELSLRDCKKVLDEIHIKKPKINLTIACGFSFASLWLRPRFTRLRQSMGNREIHLIASDSIDDLDQDMIDIRILWREKSWPGREVRALLPQVFLPVCSPEFAARHKLSMADPATLQRLASLPLLHCSPDGSHDITWSRWFSQHNVGYPQQNPDYIHDHVQYMMQSALDSEGIALGSYHFVDRYLERGDLVQIGSAIEGSENMGWIEFEPTRVSKQDRNSLFEWFSMESKCTPSESTNNQT